MQNENKVEIRKNLTNKAVFLKVIFISFIFWLTGVFIFLCTGEEMLIFYGSIIIFLPCMLGISIVMLVLIEIFRKEVNNKQLFYYSLICLAIIIIYIFLSFLIDYCNDTGGGGGGGNSGHFG